MLKVEAGVLECLRLLDNGLAKILNLFLGRKLETLAKVGKWRLAELAYHDLSLVWLVRQVDSDLEDICKDW